jgi:hypothetical protein
MENNNTTLKQKCIELLEAKCTALEQMLDITKDIIFTGSAENIDVEIESFTELYSKRTEILTHIEKNRRRAWAFGPIKRRRHGRHCLSTKHHQLQSKSKIDCRALA